MNHHEPRRRGDGSVVKAEKPRSSVMPRCLLCGFLSKAAVDANVDSALAARVAINMQMLINPKI